MILGIDEVGRGPWAGPLVVGAVILDGVNIDGLTDSKKLSKKKRELLCSEIKSKAAEYSTGWVDASEIDDIGLSAALKLATVRAVDQIKSDYTEIIIDGTVNFLADTNKAKYVTTLKKADLLVPSVSAASIIAKVARDKFMSNQDAIYNGYKFSEHVGYGTADHISAINKLGVTKIHRISVKPLQKYKNNIDTTKLIGDRAESVATDYLSRLGHKILARNWKTRYCEIDIVSSHNKILYFNEVKYRKKSDYGDGLTAITPSKIKQMKFAAKIYLTTKNISDSDIILTVISLAGDPPFIENLLEIN